MKMVYYKPDKVTIDASALAKVIIEAVIQHHGLPHLIVCDWGSVFTSKFWSSLCYFLSIKRKLSTAFHLQTDSQTERQNSNMEAYLWACVNFVQDDWAIRIAAFAYNNVKNTSTGHTLFELNCGYHPQASYKEYVDPHFQSKSVDKLVTKLRELIIICKENLQHAQKLQKRYHDKYAKPRSYGPGEKVWFNSKYIKTKRNRKLEAKFFKPFRVLYPIVKQAEKFYLLVWLFICKWKVFNSLLLMP